MMPGNAMVKAALLTTVLTLVLAFCACEDKSVPPPQTLGGDWIVTNEATSVETLLELEQIDDNLTGFWHPTELLIRVTGRITPSNEFNLTGQSSNRTFVFNAEANDGLSHFSGTLSVFDVRGDRVSLQMISGRRSVGAPSPALGESRPDRRSLPPGTFHPPRFPTSCPEVGHIPASRSHS